MDTVQSKPVHKENKMEDIFATLEDNFECLPGFDGDVLRIF